MELRLALRLTATLCLLTAVAGAGGVNAQNNTIVSYPPPEDWTWEQLSSKYWTWYPASPAEDKTEETGGCLPNFRDLRNTYQSPIALTSNPRVVNSNARLPPLPKIVFRYGSEKTKLTLANNGHTVELELDPEEGEKPPRRWIETIGAQYPKILRNLHFHYPSEHLLDGKRYAMEIHFVHQGEEDKRPGGHTVVAVLVAIGPTDNAALTPLIEKMVQLKTAGKKVDVENFGGTELMNILPSNKTYIAYRGSLTTPPCKGNNVLSAQEWRVLITPILASQAQVDLFKDAIQYNRPETAWSNARPLQQTQDATRLSPVYQD